MTKSLNTVLARFEAWLRANRSGYLDQLLPPATGDGLANAARIAEVADPGSLSKLYAWRGGQSSDLYEFFWHNFRFLNPEDMSDLIEYSIGAREDGDFPEVTWRSWIPFLTNGKAQLVVDFAGAFDGVPGQVIETWSNDIEKPIILAPSLEDWFDVFTSGLEQDLWAYRDVGLQPRDEAKVKAFQQKMLPGFPRTVVIE